jgi:hypothetical protein
MILEAIVRKSKRLAIVAVAAAALMGVSAFGETRPENRTRVRRDAGGAVRRERAVERSESGRRHETRNAPAARSETPRRSEGSIDVRGSRETEARREARGIDRGDGARRQREAAVREETRRTDRTTRDRNESYRQRSERSDRSRGRDEAYRGDRSSRGRDDGYRGRQDSHSRGSYRSGRQPYYAHGRVSRVHRHGHGYRVWVHGARYPFFVPAAYYHRDRFRIGLMIRLGGWYNDAGYYDYYDGRDYYNRSAAELYGIVESVDYRRNTFVVRNEATGSFVTVRARDREADRLRAGDVVELYGDWTRSGYFEARDVDLIDSYRR